MATFISVGVFPTRITPTPRWSYAPNLHSVKTCAVFLTNAPSGLIIGRCVFVALLFTYYCYFLFIIFAKEVLVFMLKVYECVNFFHVFYFRKRKLPKTEVMPVKYLMATPPQQVRGLHP